MALVQADPRPDRTPDGRRALRRRGQLRWKLFAAHAIPGNLATNFQGLLDSGPALRIRVSRNSCLNPGLELLPDPRRADHQRGVDLGGVLEDFL